MNPYLLVYLRGKPAPAEKDYRGNILVFLSKPDNELFEREFFQKNETKREAGEHKVERSAVIIIRQNIQD
jgi:hypothetical protein